MTTIASNKQCVVSFSNGNNNYTQGLARLSDSLRNNFDGDFLAFVGEASCGAELHADNPYNFKIHCIERAKEAGYEKVLWLDSSCFAVGQLQPVFDEIEKDGFIFQDAGHLLGNWCNDRTLRYFDLTRDKAMEIRMIGNAGFLGFDFTKTKALRFFDEWRACMERGYFKGAWTNNDKTEGDDERILGHRHDMSCSSALVYQLGLSELAKSSEEWLQYGGIYDKVLNETILIKAQGL